MAFPALKDFLTDVVLSPFSRFLHVEEQTYWPTYVCALILAVGVYLVSRRRSSLRGLMRYLWPKKLVRARSTWLDLKMYIFSSMYFVVQGAAVFAIMGNLSMTFRYGLERLIGPGAPDGPLPAWANITVPVVLYLALELGYWIGHWLMHRVPFLWEFHKVHHSAEIMTPLTEWRQHPVEFLVVPLAISLTTSLTLAGYSGGSGRKCRSEACGVPGLSCSCSRRRSFICATPI